MYLLIKCESRIIFVNWVYSIGIYLEIFVVCREVYLNDKVWNVFVVVDFVKGGV